MYAKAIKTICAEDLFIHNQRLQHNLQHTSTNLVILHLMVNPESRSYSILYIVDVVGFSGASVSCSMRHVVSH